MQKSISEILTEKYGISAKSGQKVECPFCQHKTFSIKRDDSIGKCFHPSCGRYITQFSDQRNELHATLENIFNDFHSALIQQKNQNNKSAYDYLVKERHIDPQVVADSMMGVIPSEYNINDKFQLLCDEITAEIKSEKEKQKSNNNRSEKLKIKTLENKINFLNEARDKLSNCIKDRVGWLCFFFTDAYYLIVAIRFRQPYSKDIVYFKPYKKIAGVFGHDMFSPYQSESLKQYNDLLIVTEGEFNTLQLQSLIIRNARANGTKHSYVNACSVGGVNNADYQIIKKLTLCPIFFFDNDTNGAGKMLVEKALEYMSVSTCTTPIQDSDLDSFIRSFGSDNIVALKEVRNILEKRETFYQSYEGIANSILLIRKNIQEHKLKSFEINKSVAKVVIEDLHNRGKFYNDGNYGYVFLHENKQLMMLHLDSIECQLLLSLYGLNPTEQIYKYLLNDLMTHSFDQGEKTKIYKLSYYNPDTFTAYLNKFNNQIYKISPESIDLLDNGSDGVLFLHDTNTEPYEIQRIDESQSLLDDILISKINFTDEKLKPNEKRLIFTLWFFSIFFESIMPTKPIAAFIGEKGSGKSITQRKTGMLLFGKNFNVTPLSDPKDFDAAVTNSAFVAFDNADSQSTWLCDKLAISATGGSIKKRELYTTNRLIELPIQCFIGITSRTPHFKRDDVAERLLILNVDTINKKISEKKLLDELSNNRNKIMSEVVYHIQEIIRSLKDNRDEDFSSTFRMADFADFAMKVARSFGIENEVNTIFEKLSCEQSEFILEDNPVVELLLEWAQNNFTEEVTNSELCNKLGQLAEQKGIEFPYKNNVRSFAQHMRSIRPSLSEYCDITEREGGGHKKFYKFVSKEENNDV